MPIVRKRYLTDKDGVEHEIMSKEDLQAILDQMTPEERKRWEIQYRFSPIETALGQFYDYTGTLRDLG
jgi:hypothetical protein